MNEIDLKLETRFVETEIKETKWTWKMGEPEFAMGFPVYLYYLNREKSYNFVNRLKQRTYENKKKVSKFL